MIRHNVDVALGLQYGDEGKGKVVKSLSKNYDYVLRFNGGGNAGHTTYDNEKKFITHLVSCGIFHGVPAIIGPGCVFNVKKLIEEVNYLESNGVSVYRKLFIAENAHIITDEHLQEETSESKIGTTRQGIGPAYRDKYNRTGLLAKDCKELSSFNLIDMYEFLYKTKKIYNILCEGAQAFHLDIDWGEYPYVTSSHCGLCSVLLNGISKDWIENVYGVAKVYETYVGSKQFENKNNPLFEKIRQLGEEFGATTGRPRQVNWLNLDRLVKSIQMNSVTHLYINKLDILMELREYQYYWNGTHRSCPDVNYFVHDITDIITLHTGCESIYFSKSKYDIEEVVAIETVYEAI